MSAVFADIAAYHVQQAERLAQAAKLCGASFRSEISLQAGLHERWAKALQAHAKTTPAKTLRLRVVKGGKS